MSPADQVLVQLGKFGIQLVEVEHSGGNAVPAEGAVRLEAVIASHQPLVLGHGDGVEEANLLNRGRQFVEAAKFPTAFTDHDLADGNVDRHFG